MKHFILCPLLVFIFYTGYGQTCLVNPNFSNFCGTQVPTPSSGSGCPTIAGNCLDNWRKSHGTPQVVKVTGDKTYNYVFMWSKYMDGQIQGEGLYASYSFLANHSYTVHINAQALTSTGKLLVYAAKGLTEGTGWTCGQPIPSPTDMKYIGEINPTVAAFAETNWQDFYLDFTPLVDYDQLWIYPSTTSTNEYQFIADLVNVCPSCSTGNIIYNTGVIPIANSKAVNIYAGSSAGTGGSGTVTINATSTTSLQAVNAVYFKNEFKATVSSGTFTAKIINCSDVGVLKPVKSDANVVNTTSLNVKKSYADITDSLRGLNKIIPPKSEMSINDNEINIYPSPGNGKINISGVIEDLKNAQIIVTDQSGKQVYKTLYNSNTNTMGLNLQNLQSGIYFIRIQTNQKTVSKKIVVNK